MAKGMSLSLAKVGGWRCLWWWEVGCPQEDVSLLPTLQQLLADTDAYMQMSPQERGKRRGYSLRKYGK